jgi:hypothetical protein
MPKVLYQGKRQTSKVRFVELDDGTVISEMCSKTDAMGVESWVQSDMDINPDIVAFMLDLLDTPPPKRKGKTNGAP